MNSAHHEYSQLTANSTRTHSVTTAVALWLWSAWLLPSQLACGAVFEKATGWRSGSRAELDLDWTGFAMLHGSAMCGRAG